MSSPLVLAEFARSTSPDANRQGSTRLLPEAGWERNAGCTYSVQEGGRGTSTDGWRPHVTMGVLSKTCGVASARYAPILVSAFPSLHTRRLTGCRRVCYFEINYEWDTRTCISGGELQVVGARYHDSGGYGHRCVYLCNVAICHSGAGTEHTDAGVNTCP